MSEHDEDGYAYEAVLVIDGTEIAATVELRGYFQPIDGYYRWYGRVATNDRVSAAMRRQEDRRRDPRGRVQREGRALRPGPVGPLPHHGHQHAALPRADQPRRTERTQRLTP